MNKRERKQAPSFSNFGFSTILLAFVMICVVTISALSLLTANSDYKLSLKVAQKNSDYYLAEETAYKQLAEIDALLADAYEKSVSKSNYFESVEKVLETLDTGSYENNCYTYVVPISNNQTLRVVLQITYPETENDTFYQISTWQSVYEEILPEDEPLNLIQ